MKFLLFPKRSQPKKFGYTPRYYDEKEEQSKEREMRIRKEIAREGGEFEEDTSDLRLRMKSSFRKYRSHTNSSDSYSGGFKSTNLLRLTILLLLTILIFSYATWGSKVFYSLLLLIPAYLYFKFKK